MLPHFWLFSLILVQSAFYGIDGNEDYAVAILPLHDGEAIPVPFTVHVWITRADTGEHSCIGIRKDEGRILVPEWCVTVGGEKRGRIAIYAPKPSGQVTSISRAYPYQRYDERFDLIYNHDDLSQLIAAPDGSPISDKPNVVALKIPKIHHPYITCFRIDGDIFTRKSQETTSVAVSWKRGPNGEFFFVQKLIDQSIIQKKSFEGLKEGIEDVAEAVLSVNHDINNFWSFEGFFKDPPKI
ncbi:uncharacterized protein LOC141854028 [Brevipalpus obovatus]|uniref:uncharacterized protein LOC141854028 n=1 Tax=Brevipalpus obovatus TaxID=246614 RepID=UPI003D9E5241